MRIIYVISSIWPIGTPCTPKKMCVFAKKMATTMMNYVCNIRKQIEEKQNIKNILNFILS